MSHPEKDCAFSKKFPKKRARGCSVIGAELSSKNASKCVSSQRIGVFNKCQNQNGETKAVFTLDEVGGTAEGKYIHTPQVRTRHFYNSSHQARNITGLLARGNKKRILSQGQLGCLTEL